MLFFFLACLSVIQCADFGIKRKLITIGDKLWFENNEGERVYNVEEKVFTLSVGKTFFFSDVEGNIVYRIREKEFHLHETYQIQTPEKDVLATIKKAIGAPHYEVIFGNEEIWKVDGEFLSYNYEFTKLDGGANIASLSYDKNREPHPYLISIQEGFDERLVLAITFAVDQISCHD